MGDFVNQPNQLALAGPLLSEAMLLGADDLVALNKVHNVTYKDVLKNFTNDRGQRDWAVIFWAVALTFFEDWGHEGCAPVMWDVAGLEGRSEEGGECGG